MMTGPLILLAMIISPGAFVAPSVVHKAQTFRAIGGATARATASVRVVSGVSFGPGQAKVVSGALNRQGRIVDEQGQERLAQLLEFQ